MAKKITNKEVLKKLEELLEESKKSNTSATIQYIPHVSHCHHEHCGICRCYPTYFITYSNSTLSSSDSTTLDFT